MFGQFIPLQTLNRTVFEYDITYYGDPEIFCPEWAPHPDAPFLSLNLTPTALGPAYYFRIPEAVVTQSLVVDVARPLRVFVELLPHPSPAQEGRVWLSGLNTRKRATALASSSVRKLSNSFIFSSAAWDNYYHFVIDCCLRYAELKAAGAMAPEVSLLVSHAPKGWQLEYLELLGIDPAALIPMPSTRERPLLISSLLVASPARSRRVVSPGAAARFRDRMLCHLPDARKRVSGRRIYISRRTSGKRRLLNELDVIERLLERGFECVTLEEMTVLDQIGLFADASVVVAPHGAGLTNIIYACKPVVIEILPVDRWNLGGFLALTHSIGGQYKPVVSTTGRSKEYLRSAADDADYVADLSKLDIALAQLGPLA